MLVQDESFSGQIVKVMYRLYIVEAACGVMTYNCLIDKGQHRKPN